MSNHDSAGEERGRTPDGSSREADRGGALPVSEQAENAEWVLDPDLEAEDPGHEVAEHAERLERHSEPTDTPAHPESPARRESPPR